MELVEEVNKFGFPYQNGERSKYYEFVKDKFYFTYVKFALRDTPAVKYFAVDSLFQYKNFACDFGPLNMGHTYRFCRLVNELLYQEKHRKVCFYSSNKFPQKTNAAVLVCLYMILYQGQDPEQAFTPFRLEKTKFLPYRDASKGISVFDLTVPDCLNGMYRAFKLGWIDFDSFSVREYEYFEQVQNGDWNWIVPGKLLAFASPKGAAKNYYELPPAYYVPHFQKMNITAVVRLNKRLYEDTSFTQNGIGCYDLSFPDGYSPPDNIMSQFLHLVNNKLDGGAAAVHCMAGLGRTGTLICGYMIKYHGFSAAESIGYSRICRPGSVVGEQQRYLIEFEWLVRNDPSLFSSPSSPYDLRSKSWFSDVQNNNNLSNNNLNNNNNINLSAKKNNLLTTNININNNESGFAPQPRKFDGRTRGLTSSSLATVEVA